MEKIKQQIKQYSKCGKIVFFFLMLGIFLPDKTNIVSLSLSNTVTVNGWKKDSYHQTVVYPLKFICSLTITYCYGIRSQKCKCSLVYIYQPKSERA